MSPIDALLILLAGMAAGAINIVVGSGTLISFPTLLFLGFPPVTASISNSLGLCAAGVTGIYGYRKELTGLGRMVRVLVPASLAGGITGAILLLVLPSSVFATVVPILIGLALLLVIFGPRINKRVSASGQQREGAARVTPATIAVVFATGMYGGYFPAAQGVILLAGLGLLLPMGLQRVNAVKNVLVAVVNTAASLTFIIVAPERMNWTVAALIGVGALIGGALGAKIGRRLSPIALRIFIVVVGVVAIVSMLL